MYITPVGSCAALQPASRPPIGPTGRLPFISVLPGQTVGASIEPTADAKTATRAESLLINSTSLNSTLNIAPHFPVGPSAFGVSPLPVGFAMKSGKSAKRVCLVAVYYATWLRCQAYGRVCIGLAFPPLSRSAAVVFWWRAMKERAREMGDEDKITRRSVQGCGRGSSILTLAPTTNINRGTCAKTKGGWN